jgi:hypothetical protein
VAQPGGRRPLPRVARVAGGGGGVVRGAVQRGEGSSGLPALERAVECVVDTEAELAQGGLARVLAEAQVPVAVVSVGEAALAGGGGGRLGVRGGLARELTARVVGVGRLPLAVSASPSGEESIEGLFKLI